MQKRTCILILSAILALLVIFSVVEIRKYQIALRSLPPTETVIPAQIQALLIAGKDIVAIMGTGSMRPYIPEGDGVVAYAEVERVKFSDLKRGDLVTFRRTKYNVIHQIVARDGDAWISSGLGNSFYDEIRVTDKNLIGRVTKTYILE